MSATPISVGFGGDQRTGTTQLVQILNAYDGLFGLQELFYGLGAGSFPSRVRMEPFFDKIYAHDVSISHSRPQKRYHRIQSLFQQSSRRHEDSIRADKSDLNVM